MYGQAISMISVALVDWGLVPVFANAGDISPKQDPEIPVRDRSVLVSKDHVMLFFNQAAVN